MQPLSGPPHIRCREGRPATESSHILRWSAALRERVLAAPPAAGRVHSIFEHALNILWHDGGLITLHGPGLLAAPFAAAVARLPDAGSLTPGVAVIRRDGRMLLGQFVLNTEGGTLADITIPPIRGRSDPLVASLASAAIPMAAPGLASPTGRTAQRRLADGIVRRDALTFVKGACDLIGLGEGLTPAGDDCLVGALAVLHRFARSWMVEYPEIRIQIAAVARTGTTMVGRDYILHALDGAFSERILHLVTASSEHDARRAVASLAGTGGTSGADTLDGVQVALEALSP
jgi:uncharacterized protein DUF2877